MRLYSPFYLLIFMLIALSFAKDSFDITRSGRKTQLDGFLMDWMEKNRRNWEGSVRWSWDAINTPDGVAGYFHTSDATVCSSWVFRVDAGFHGPCEMVVSMVKDTENGFYCTSRSQQGKQSSITVEWILPWDSAAVDENGSYAMTITGNSACRDSLEPIVLTGKRSEIKNTLPGYFALKIVAIIVLFMVFVFFQLKIRKKSRRKGSPRQSA
jgi:hypothetical protein